LFAVNAQPEVFFSTAATSRAVNYAVRTGRARRIARGVYTANMTDRLEVVVGRNYSRIAAHVFPGAVIVDRSALEMGPAADGSLTLAARRGRNVTLPGLWLRARVGAGPLEGDLRWMGEDLFMSSRARAFLENCRPSRTRGGLPRTVGRPELEVRLDTYAGRDVENLNRLRDAARGLAPALGADAEFSALDDLIGALQGTRPTPLISGRGRARVVGAPYDQSRLVRFEQLARHLLEVGSPRRSENPEQEISTFAFFEAYFSNFIEGTEFTLQEAEAIVFEAVIPRQRPQDAHDILGTYRIVADPKARARIPRSAEAFVALLREQHATMLAARPEIGPGSLKEDPNQAGATLFVAPEFVEGTLRESWRLYESLPDGFARAAFAMFVVSEVHPFADGSGRMARVLMNAELTAAGEQRIVIPTVLRDDYLSGLRAMTHNALAANYMAVLSSLQAFTAGVDFSTRAAAELDLYRRRAFDDHSQRPGVLGRLLGHAAPGSGGEASAEPPEPGEATYP
jgi:hypothetical protein